MIWIFKKLEYHLQLITVSGRKNTLPSMLNANLRGLLTLFLFLPTLASFSQTYEFPWAVSAGASMVKYQTHPSEIDLPGSIFSPSVNIAATKYLAGAFDFRTKLMLSNRVTYPTAEAALNSPMIDLSYNLLFKVNNGVFMRENGFLGPYLILGFGGSYLQNKPDLYLPVGGGIRFKLSQRMALRVETTQKISFNKDVQHIAHAIAFVYNLDTKDIPVEKIDPEELDEQMIVAALLPADSDLDGVIDLEDKCPDVAGTIAGQGCPEEDAGMEDIANAITSETPVVEPEEVAVATPPAETHEATYPDEEDNTFGQLYHLDGLLTDELPAEETYVVAESTQQPVIKDIPQEIQVPVTEPAEIETPAEIENTTYASVEIPKTTEATVRRPEEVAATSQMSPCGTFSLDDAHVLPIHFETGSDKLPEEAKPLLDKVAAMLQSCPETQLVLNGHADATGGEKKNLILSIMRAYHVKYYLVYEHGISQRRINSKGFGENQPLANNDVAEGRLQNRRVDFQLIF